MNGNFPNPRVAYQQPLHFAIPIELGGTIVSELTEEQSVLMTSFSDCKDYE